LKKKKYLERS